MPETTEPYDLPFPDHWPPGRPEYVIVVDQLRDWRPGQPPSLAELLEAKVGTLAYGETSDPFRIPLEHILTDAADRDAVTSALDAELAGGAETGFDPVLEDDQTLVAFTNTVVHARRRPG